MSEERPDHAGVIGPPPLLLLFRVSFTRRQHVGEPFEPLGNIAVEPFRHGVPARNVTA